MKRTKPGKAAGVDDVCPELLRADMEDTASRLTSCYNRLRESERWPKVWKRGLVRVFKKRRFARMQQLESSDFTTCH